MTKLSGSDAKSTLYCSFCGKSQHEVRKLMAGPTVFICDECVELCNDIIREEAGLPGHREMVPADIGISVRWEATCFPALPLPTGQASRLSGSSPAGRLDGQDPAFGASGAGSASHPLSAHVPEITRV